jgi:hypothetical protein
MFRHFNPYLPDSARQGDTGIPDLNMPKAVKADKLSRHARLSRMEILA